MGDRMTTCRDCRFYNPPGPINWNPSCAAQADGWGAPRVMLSGRTGPLFAPASLWRRVVRNFLPQRLEARK